MGIIILTLEPYTETKGSDGRTQQYITILKYNIIWVDSPIKIKGCTCNLHMYMCTSIVGSYLWLLIYDKSTNASIINFSGYYMAQEY